MNNNANTKAGRYDLFALYCNCGWANPNLHPTSMKTNNTGIVCSNPHQLLFFEKTIYLPPSLSKRTSPLFILMMDINVWAVFGEVSLTIRSLFCSASLNWLILFSSYFTLLTRALHDFRYPSSLALSIPSDSEDFKIQIIYHGVRYFSLSHRVTKKSITFYHE